MKNTAIVKKHGKHGNWRKTRKTGLPCFRDFLLSLVFIVDRLYRRTSRLNSEISERLLRRHCRQVFIVDRLYRWTSRLNTQSSQRLLSPHCRQVFIVDRLFRRTSRLNSESSQRLLRRHCRQVVIVDRLYRQTSRLNSESSQRLLRCCWWRFMQWVREQWIDSMNASRAPLTRSHTYGQKQICNCIPDVNNKSAQFFSNDALGVFA